MASNLRLADERAEPPTPWSYWVVERLLLAGAYPGAPAPDRAEQKIRLLLGAGIRAFVNLMEVRETNYDGQLFAPYDDAARRLCPEITCLRFPIQDLSVPSADRMTSILDAIDGSLTAAVPVYVHCWGGIGRTGMVVGCWMLRHGLATPDTVLDVLTRLRRQDQERGHKRSPETEEQRRFVRAWDEDKGRP